MYLKLNGFLEADALLILNGLLPNSIPDSSLFKSIFCTDGALNSTLEKGIKPNAVIGDLDSIKNVAEDILLIETPDQNKTDFHKALEYLVDEGFKSVLVIGGEAKEEDHFLGNLYAATQLQKQLSIRFMSDYQYYFLADNETKIDGLQNQIVSLFPFPVAKSVETKGLKYALNKEDLSIAERIGTRNSAISSEIEVKFTSGNLWIFINKK